MSTVTITRRGEERVHAGHPWIYKSDVVRPNGTAGEVVGVLGHRERVIGHALYSDRSEITLRMVTRRPEGPDRAFWRARLDQAIRYRESLAIDATAYRLVHGEADLIPSFVVDRYGDYLVVQALSQGIDRLLPDLVGHLVDLVQ